MSILVDQYTAWIIPTKLSNHTNFGIANFVGIIRHAHNEHHLPTFDKVTPTCVPTPFGQQRCDPYVKGSHVLLGQTIIDLTDGPINDI
jgi:hypothetical protein